MITTTDRFIKTLNGDIKNLDRLPCIEWAGYWDLTQTRWESEGLEKGHDSYGIHKMLGLDNLRQWWFGMKRSDCPQPTRQGGGIMADADDYERIKPFLYPKEEAARYIEKIKNTEAVMHNEGKCGLWFTMDGGFWYPRTLFGITEHLYSFYDEPELYHRILDDLADFQLWILEQIYDFCTPEFMTFAEDMSYNKGPMIGKKQFDEFLLPYYKRIVPFIKAHGTHPMVDSDGNITEMVPWLMEAGIEGALPLEWQAGVDVPNLRKLFPEWIMLGGYNKRIMKDGEQAMIEEFERLLPVMRQGRYIPGVDHQTPPDVSLENYKIYVSLLKKYCELAVK